MAPRPESSHLKRARVGSPRPIPRASTVHGGCAPHRSMNGLLTRLLQGSPAEVEHESKKPRRSERLSQRQDNVEPHKTPISTKQHLPSPVTYLTPEETSELFKEATVTPPEGRPSQLLSGHDDAHGLSQGLSSPPQDTQAVASQYMDPNAALSDDVQDEVKEGVWGYLFPLYTKYGGRCVVLKKRGDCPRADSVADPLPQTAKKPTSKGRPQKEEEIPESTRVTGASFGGVLDRAASRVR